MNIICSGSKDGTIIVHNLQKGKYVRTIRRSHFPSPIEWVGISSTSHIVSYSSEDVTICTHSVNGKLLAKAEVNETLHCFEFSEDGEYLLTGGDRRVVTTWDLSTLRQEVDTYGKIDGRFQNIPKFDAAITSLKLTRHERHLLVGLKSGILRVLALDAQYLRDRLQKKLENLGF